MTPELFWLTLSALLAASLWLPYVIGINATPVTAPAEPRPHDPSATVPWVHRAWRAHLNMIEQFAPFAGLVLIAHAAGVTNAATVAATAAFFFLRLAHAVWMIAGLPVLPVRPILFTLGWLCCLVVGIATLVA